MRERNTSTVSALFLVTLGGILALLGPFLLLYCTADLTGVSSEYRFLERGFTGIQEIPDYVGNYSLGWAIAVCGVLAIAFAAIASSLHRNSVAAFVPVFGLISLTIPIWLAMQLSDYLNLTLVHILYTSNVADNVAFILIYLGGVVAFVGGFLTFAGGLLLITRIWAYSKQKMEEERAYQKKLARETEKREEFEEKATRAKLVRNFMASTSAERGDEPTDVEMEELLSSMVTLVVPPFIDIGATGQLIAIVSNKTDETVDKIKMDLSDFEPYFEVSGEMKFINIRPGTEARGVVKITPKREEGTYPVIIEVSQGETSIERKFLITVKGRDAY